MTRYILPTLKPTTALAALASAGLLLTGCQKEEITVYRVPKVPPGAGEATAATPGLPPGKPAPAAAASAPRPHAHWDKIPADWREVPANQSRAASFVITGPNKTSAEAAIIAFPGMGGTDLQFVNLWRQQLGLAPLTDDDLPKLVQPAIIAGADGKLFDLTGAPKSGGDPTAERIIVALQKQDGVSWFIKLTGPAALVEQQKPAFLSFLKTLKFHAGADEAEPSAKAQPPPVPPRARTQASPPGLPPRTGSNFPPARCRPRKTPSAKARRPLKSPPSSSAAWAVG